MIGNNLMPFSKKIAELRKEKDWSQAELAKKVGVHQRYVSSWETDKSMPHAETLIKLAQVFEVSTDYLLFDNVPREGISKINDFDLYEQFRQTDLLPEDLRKSLKQVISGVVFRYKVDAARSEVEQQQTVAHTRLRKVAGRR